MPEHEGSDIFTLWSSGVFFSVSPRSGFQDDSLFEFAGGFE